MALFSFDQVANAVENETEVLFQMFRPSSTQLNLNTSPNPLLNPPQLNSTLIPVPINSTNPPNSTQLIPNLNQVPIHSLNPPQLKLNPSSNPQS